MEESIKCPKCGSSQISSNKRGWSIVTGVIGMNKIVLTCFKCGNQFKIGQDLDNIKSKNVTLTPTQLEKRKKLNKKILLYLGVPVIILWIIILIIPDDKTNSISTPIKIDSSQTTLQKENVEDLEKYYSIEKLDVGGSTQKNIFIYIKDINKVELINKMLIEKYNPNKEFSMSVYYFTKKGIGKTYLSKQNSEDISEDEKDKLFKDFYCNYTFNSTNSYENMNYPHK